VKKIKTYKIVKPEKDLKKVLLKDKLISGWNKYSEANIYQVRCVKNHKDQLVNLFLPIECQSPNVLEIGAGTGPLIEDIMKIMVNGGNYYGIDWSSGMLEKAKKRAEKIKEKHNKVDFFFSRENLEEALPYDDGFFDAIFSLQVLCYIRGGWKLVIKELERVLNPGGHLYVAPLVDEDFIKHAIKHFIAEFFRQPIVSIRGLKYRKIISEIAEEAKEQGSEFPDPEELMEYLNTLGFQEIESTITYWGGGRAIRAQKS